MADAKHGTSGGTELTDERLDQLSDEAERGYEPGQLRVRSRRGRPPIGEEAATVFHVRLSPSLRTALERAANAQETTPSDIVRKALKDFLDRRSRNPAGDAAAEPRNAEGNSVLGVTSRRERRPSDAGDHPLPMPWADRFKEIERVFAAPWADRFAQIEQMIAVPWADQLAEVEQAIAAPWADRLAEIEQTIAAPWANHLTELEQVLIAPFTDRLEEVEQAIAAPWADRLAQIDQVLTASIAENFSEIEKALTAPWSDRLAEIERATAAPWRDRLAEIEQAVIASIAEDFYENDQTIAAPWSDQLAEVRESLESWAREAPARVSAEDGTSTGDGSQPVDRQLLRQLVATYVFLLILGLAGTAYLESDALHEHFDGGHVVALAFGAAAIVYRKMDDS